MRQNNPLKSSNIVINKNNRFFEIILEINTTIKSLATLIVYNWQSADATDSFIFSTALYIWNSIRHTYNNDKSSTLYCHLI